MDRLPTTSYALLGLLLPSPMSGYELSSRVGKSIANFWPIARSQVYRELARLEALDYLRGADVVQDRVPDKRVYEVTPAGKAAVEAWLADPDVRRERFRSTLLVKIFFADHIPPDRLDTLLKGCRQRAEREAARLAAIAASLEGKPGLDAPRATALHGLHHMRATLAWLDEVEPMLRRVSARQPFGGEGR